MQVKIMSQSAAILRQPRYRLRYVLAILAMFTLPLAANDAAVQVQDHGDGHYTLTVELGGTTDPAHGQLVITPTARELCGILHPHFGRYRFEAKEPSRATGTHGESSITYTQQIQCRDTPQKAAETLSDPVPPAPSEPPTEQDAALVRERTLAYLRGKDASDATTVYAMLTREMASYATPEVWTETRKSFSAKAGPGARPEVIRITWYDNPQGAPTLGRYAAADYRVDYPSRAFTCGYVVWLRQADGSYLVIREEEGQATPELVRDLPPEGLATMRTQLQCRD